MRYTRRAIGPLAGGAAAVLAAGRATPAAACAGLIGSNGAVNLGRTSTLAAYADGSEHYVTAFQFQGGGGQFGTLIPLPGIPTKVERGGAWTLQRLVRETEPPAPLRAAAGLALSAAAEKADVLLETKVDALDLTVLRGGGPSVAEWAQGHGFRLSPDAPEVLDFYARRSPIFLAAVFDGLAAAARGQRLGDGTPVHLTIPVEQPWVPLRILGLGKRPEDRVEADVYLLTEKLPALLPGPRGAMSLLHSAPATPRLLDDLRGDAGMGWVPPRAWLTKLRVDGSAAGITYDLAIDAHGRGRPSPVAAGLEAPVFVPRTLGGTIAAARQSVGEFTGSPLGSGLIGAGGALTLVAAPVLAADVIRRRLRAERGESAERVERVGSNP